MALRNFRENFKFIVWIVAIAFIAWLVFEIGAGILNFTNPKPWERGIVAEVGNYKISSEYYEYLVQAEIQETLRVRGVEFLPPEEEESIREAVFYRMVDNIRWKKLAEKLGIKLSDKAILTLVMLLPPPELMRDTNFFRDGNFNYQLYLQVLNDKRYAPIFSAYEAKLKEEVPPDLARFLISKIPLPSKEYLWKKYTLENTKYGFDFLNIVYARISDDKVKKPSEDELKRYFERNKEKFLQPPSADIYILRVEKSPSKEDSLQAKEFILRAKKEAERDWNGAVKTYSEDLNSKDSGGNLGWLYVLVLPENVRNDIEKSDTGAILGPYDVPGGYNIVKVLEKNKKGDSVNLSHIFVSIKTSYQTKQKLRDTLLKFLDLAKKRGFREASKELGFKLDSTGEFKLNLGFIPFIGPDRSLINFIRKGKKGDISGIIYKPEYYAVIQIIGKKEGGIPKFEEVRREVERAYILEEKRKIAEAIAKDVIERIKRGESPDSIRAKYPEVYLGSADSANFNTFVPGVANREVFFRALAISKEKGWSGPFDYKDGLYYIFKKYELKPDRADFERRVQQLILQNQQMEAFEILSNLQRDLEDLMPLKDYRGYLY